VEEASSLLLNFFSSRFLTFSSLIVYCQFRWHFNKQPIQTFRAI
jgi:hypothetical protein